MFDHMRSLETQPDIASLGEALVAVRGDDPLFGTTIESYYKGLHKRILIVAIYALQSGWHVFGIAWADPVVRPAQFLEIVEVRSRCAYIGSLSPSPSCAIFNSTEPKPLALIRCFPQVLQRTRAAPMQMKTHRSF